MKDFMSENILSDWLDLAIDKRHLGKLNSGIYRVSYPMHDTRASIIKAEKNVSINRFGCINSCKDTNGTVKFIFSFIYHE